MPIELLMPALSPTMTEGNLAKWHKKEGDPVKAGDVIAEIETDKATMEFEAVDEGTLGKILVPEGAEGVKVNQQDGARGDARRARRKSRGVETPAGSRREQARTGARNAEDGTTTHTARRAAATHLRAR